MGEEKFGSEGECVGSPMVGDGRWADVGRRFCGREAGNKIIPARNSAGGADKGDGWANEGERKRWPGIGGACPTVVGRLASGRGIGRV